MTLITQMYARTARWCVVVLMILAGAVTFVADAHAGADEEPGADEAASKTVPVFVRMTTTKGEIYLELNREKAPETVANFMRYVNDEFYDGTIFHRVMENFMIQGGGFTPEMRQKPTRDPITNEWRNGLKNERGTIAMARTANPDSATAQFFINVRDNPNLDQPISGGAGYAVFGRVVHGMDVVDAIRKVQTTQRGSHGNVPVEPIIIERVREVSQEDVNAARGDDSNADQPAGAKQPSDEKPR